LKYESSLTDFNFSIAIRPFLGFATQKISGKSPLIILVIKA
jgi:hypothetical protein